MPAHSRSRVRATPFPRRRFAPWAALALLHGCSSPLGGQDVDLGLGLSGSPGVGGTLSLSQRITQSSSLRLDFEGAYVGQFIDETPDATDGRLDELLLGGKLSFTPEDSGRWTVRAGLVWLRARGDPEFLDGAGDYIGAYAGFGYEFDISEHLSTGPDVMLLKVDAEGSGDSGAIPQIAWRLLWHL